MRTAIGSKLTLEEVVEHFNQWRRVKSKGERIPDRLWSEAVSLLGAYGISQVTRSLRLSGTDLNKHREIIRSGRSRQNGGGKTGFVEIDRALVSQASGPEAGAAWMELERPDGLRLRFQMPHGADMLVLIDHFMGG